MPDYQRLRAERAIIEAGAAALRSRAIHDGYRGAKAKHVAFSARDPRAIGYGTYMLTDPQNNTLVAYRLQSGYGLSLDQIEKELTS